VRRCLLALSVTSTVLFAPVAFATPAAAAPEATVNRYVALGDSYAAGPFIPLPTGSPPGCLRSSRNYPSLVAQTLTGAEFADVSCSGATTRDMFTAQHTDLGTNPPQLDALDDHVALVTLTIGGNDIGFVEIIKECAHRSPKRPFGAACKDFYTSGGTDRIAARIDATASKIARVLDEIVARAPDATVLLVGYPVILPDEGPGCFPVVPFSAGDVAYLRESEKRLNAMLEGEAEQADAVYVDTYTPSIGHDVCKPPRTKWVEGFVPTSPAAPVHPNGLGMTAMAVAVAEELADQDVEPAA